MVCIKSRVGPRKRKIIVTVSNNEFIKNAADNARKEETFMVKYPMFNNKHDFVRTPEMGVVHLD